jgi:EpsD family peptidyl-prolyl cis-trans isomerase
MKPWAKLALSAAACVVLTDCKLPWTAAAGGGSQVVATVQGRQITKADLDAEMAGAPAPDAAHLQGAEANALRDMIARDIMARAARAQGLDRTPAFRREVTRVSDTLLAQALQEKLATTPPPTTRAAAMAFMGAHPDLFAQRKIFTLDQIRLAPPSDPALLKALSGLTSLDQIAAALAQSKTPFQRDTAQLDAVGAAPALVEALAKAPPGQLFVLPQGAILSINQIKATRTEPFTGEPAIAYAQKVLTTQADRGAVQNGLKVLFAKAAKQVKVAKGYELANPTLDLATPPVASPAKPVSGG